jgi:hypothetical protein
MISLVTLVILLSGPVAGKKKYYVVLTHRSIKISIRDPAV